MKDAMMEMSFVVVLIGLLLIGLPGGKKNSDPAPSPNTPATTAAGAQAMAAAVAAIAQTTCPVMDGNPIDKNVFTEYKGQKVYFCCPACIDKFKAEPEKYAANLPQFKE